MCSIFSNTFRKTISNVSISWETCGDVLNSNALVLSFDACHACPGDDPYDYLSYFWSYFCENCVYYFHDVDHVCLNWTSFWSPWSVYCSCVCVLVADFLHPYHRRPQRPHAQDRTSPYLRFKVQELKWRSSISKTLQFLQF